MASLPVSPLAPAKFPDLPEISGVRLGAGAAGVKYQGRDDVMLVELAEGSVIAGVFTKSSTRSASVIDCQAKLGNDPTGKAAIFVNSGNSNAFTGAKGAESVSAICASVAKRIGCDQSRVFTSSTGVIGEPLPHDRILAVMDDIPLAQNGMEPAARAIMTTDTFAKGSVSRVKIDGTEITITGFAKGSGMIAPDMATMLVYIFTDAVIDQAMLQKIVSQANERTFNAITVDSDTSTSDTVLVAATCRAGNREITENDGFAQAIENVMQDLAHQVVKDGEGASKFVEVSVSGARDDIDARKVGLAIANSPLVKTAIAGEDPNWGRIVMAVGKSGAEADRDLLTIKFGDILVAEKGWVSESYTEQAGAEYFKQDNLIISVDLGLGTGAGRFWTCDLTHQYITINADYRS